jgi:hypothetical protein
MGRAQNISMREARRYEVVGMAATTGEEAGIFSARHRLAQREFHRSPPMACGAGAYHLCQNELNLF